MRPLRRLTAAGSACAGLVALLVGATATPRAQVAAPNARGVAMGHVHYFVRDVAASRAFWVTLGDKPSGPAGPDGEAIVFPGVVVRLSAGSREGGTEGSVLNHVAFRVPSFGPLEAAGLTVTRLAQFPGVGSVMNPDGERIELFEDAATNLTFTPDTGPATGILARHGQPVGRPIAFHHMHLYLPDAAAVSAAKGWYARLFGGVGGKRSQYDAVDLPGVNLNFSVGPRPVVPTKGRVLDHIGFEVTGLETFCRTIQREAPVDGSCSRSGKALTVHLIDPWGTSIELTEPSAQS